MARLGKSAVNAGQTEYADMDYAGEQLRDRREESRRVERGAFDLPFFLLTLLILSIGVVMVLSASFARAYFKDGNGMGIFLRQLGFSGLGIALMIFLSTLPSTFYRRMTPLLVVITGFLLALVPFLGTGKSEVGANRWFNLGFTTFQPSEIAKIAIILLFAHMICLYRGKMKTFRYGVVPFAGVLAVTVFLLILEPHLSASVIIIAIGAIMMFVGGAPLWCFLLGVGVVGVVGFVVVNFFPYASSRITVWQDPWSDPLNKGLQTIQSLYAIGSGGMTGLGLGQGRQKYMYLPEEHNDFIFSIVCEELGFIGAMLILFLFAVLIIRGYWLALHAKDRFGSLVIVGIVSLLAIQVFLNVAVVTNLVPCTGISLPFFSYGGTALLIQLGEMGIVLSISREIPLRKKKSEDVEEP